MVSLHIRSEDLILSIKFSVAWQKGFIEDIISLIQ